MHINILEAPCKYPIVTSVNCDPNNICCQIYTKPEQEVWGNIGLNELKSNYKPYLEYPRSIALF